MMKNTQMTLKQLINRYPEVKVILNKYHIDYDLGEMDTIEEATMIMGLRPDLLFKEMMFIEAVA